MMDSRQETEPLRTPSRNRSGWTTLSAASVSVPETPLESKVQDEIKPESPRVVGSVESQDTCNRTAQPETLSHRETGTSRISEAKPGWRNHSLI